MKPEITTHGPVLRLFEVRTKAGCSSELIEKFATTSAAVVENEPGNRGYFYGRLVHSRQDVVIFASLWRDTSAIKERFGEEWQDSFLPPGYEHLIDECSVRHFDLSSGWHVHDH